jgi:hypothetical protein
MGGRSGSIVVIPAMLIEHQIEKTIVVMVPQRAPKSRGGLTTPVSAQQSIKTQQRDLQLLGGGIAQFLLAGIVDARAQ